MSGGGDCTTSIHVCDGVQGGWLVGAAGFLVVHAAGVLIVHIVTRNNAGIIEHVIPFLSCT